jgi:hypothetical protein
MMKNSDLFLKNLLILLIVVITYTYIRQQKNKASRLTNINNFNDIDNNTILENTIKTIEAEIKQKISDLKTKKTDINKNNLVEFTNGKTYLGPEHNFHQSFNNQHNKELGWRKWWFNNQINNTNLENKEDQFQPKMRNYFNNQENTKNIYLN